jgi:hypothetical protein
MQDLLAQLTEQVRQYVPNLLAAIAILVLGWFAALVIGAMVRGAINRLTRGKKLPETAEGARPLPVGAWTGRVVFWILMIFVLAAAFQALQLPALVGPLDSMLQQVTQFLPQLAGAAILLAIAWAIGAALRFVVVKALERTGVERRVEESTGLKTERPLSQTLGEVVFWLPMLLFVPAVLGVLELQGLLTPLQGMFDDLLGVLPNLLGAALIMLIGWFMAKILRQIVTALLSAAGADRVGERIGMGPEAGNRRLSAVVGLVVYALILIPAYVDAEPGVVSGTDAVRSRHCSRCRLPSREAPLEPGGKRPGGCGF